jgi:hypothetical protein
MALKPGDKVSVTWGLEGKARGTVLEVWGDPPQHVRVELVVPGADEHEEPAVLLLSPDVVEAA